MEKKIFSKDFNKSALRNYFMNNMKNGNEIHNIQIYTKGELLLRFAPTPYDCSEKSEVYSLSKSFASTAIGIACDNGLMTIEDRLIDIFPDKLPDQVSENLCKMRVKHLLSMSTGHEICVMPHVFDEHDGVKAFFAQPIKNEPGSCFCYNTGASYMLAAIVAKVTGYSLLDYLNVKLFFPLGIVNTSWEMRGGEINSGGIELNISSDDMMKFGILYLNKGMFLGKRILSEDFIKAATNIQIDTPENGTPDWKSGYGYQFWINANGGFRGDGAFGQLCMVFPKTETVVVVRGETADMQNEIDLVRELLEECGISSGKEVSDSDIFVYPTLENTESNINLIGSVYECETNKADITLISTCLRDDLLFLGLSDGKKVQSIVAGNGTWEISEIYVKAFKPKLMDIMDYQLEEKLRLKSCYTIQGNTIHIECRLLNAPHKIDIMLSVAEDRIELDVLSKHNLVESSIYPLKGTLVS